MELCDLGGLGADCFWVCILGLFVLLRAVCFLVVCACLLYVVGEFLGCFMIGLWVLDLGAFAVFGVLELCLFLCVLVLWVF